MQCAFLNTRGWKEEKWRTLVEEGKNYSVIGVTETGWHNRIEWSEGGWHCIDKGRKIGEKKGGGVGVIVKEQCSRRMEETKLSDEMENRLNHSKGDIIRVKVTDHKDVWWITVVYMGVEGRDNFDNNRKLYEALLEIKEKVGREKW